MIVIQLEYYNICIEKGTPNIVDNGKKELAHGSTSGGTSAAESMASQLHNNYRLQQMASEGFELSSKSIGGRKTPSMTDSPKGPYKPSEDK